MKKIKNDSFDSEPTDKNTEPLSEWYVNHFILDRKGYFIITESKSLYSIIEPSVGISNKKIFEDWVKSVIARIEKENELQGTTIVGKEIIMCKTNNRSILGSQNELIRMAESIFYYDDENHDDFSRINETPMTYTNSFPNIDIKKEIRKRKDF